MQSKRSVGLGNSGRRERSGQGKDPEADKILAASFRGQWVTVARTWLEQNGPCTKQEYMIGVIKMMPTHILMDGKKRGRPARLANQALRRIAICRPDGLYEAAAREKAGRKPKYDHQKTVDRFIDENGVIATRKTDLVYPERKVFNEWLARNFDRIGFGVFRKRAE